MQFTLEEATLWVQDLYGVKGTLNPLPGEVDLNYRVKTPQGNDYIFKVSAPGSSPELMDMQTALLEHVASSNPSLTLPRVIPLKTGERMHVYAANGEASRTLRMLSWVPGRVWAEVRPHSPALLESLGKLCGQVSFALKEFDHPSAHRFIKWDPLQLPKVAVEFERLIPDVQTDKLKSGASKINLMELTLDLFRSKVAPLSSSLRKSVNHNDANDYNILVSEDKAKPVAKCLVDYGDAVYTYTINELAIAIAYAVMGQKDPLSAACEVVKGYHAVFPLEEKECEVLFPLILARLAISVYCAAENQLAHPDNLYLQISNSAAWDLLAWFWFLPSPEFAQYRFREVCGFEPCAKKKIFQAWLDQKPAIFPLMIPPESPDQLTELDLSVGSLALGNHRNYGESTLFEQCVQHILSKKGATMGIGGYGEIRPFYSTENYTVAGNEGPRWRTVHLGLDLWDRVGAKVFAPLPGKVESVQYNSGLRNYGYTLILSHAVSDELKFYTLYGHLGKDAQEKWRPGDAVEGGALIGHLGNAEENGAWPPHLHFQVIMDTLGFHGDFPGVAFPEERFTWLSICPDPAWLCSFWKPDQTIAKEKEEKAVQILSKRKDILGKSLSLSYDRHLHIVRGQMQYLLDSTGRKYLDLVNNVAHVGHENPRVVDAAQQQMAVLNTNTRYLHEELVNFAEELLDTFPPELCVCHFVNSGSEANELALRMAKTYTGQQDMIALQVGYHGNTGACIEVSSYKFDGKGGKGAPSHTHLLPLPDVYRGIYTNPTDAGNYYTSFAVSIIDSLVKKGENIAGCIVESVLSCGGQIVLPDHYLSELYHIVREQGAVCIADEVQVGLGRVGEHFWGFQLQGVRPDIVTIGKPIGNGHPLAAVVCTREIADAFANGMEYFSTFGGNPVSCAIGKQVVQIVQEEGLQTGAFHKGNFLKKGLHELQKNYPIIGDVRGKGLFLGIELVKNPSTKEPAAAEATYLANRMRSRGILISTDGPDYNVLKVKPPLCIETRDLERVLETMDVLLKEDMLKI